MSQSLSPDKVLDTTDPGDDMQRRVRYQAAYAALLSIKLLDGESDYDEVFCEHHEDVMIKKKDSTFIGIQVKTRISSLDPFKSDDEQIRKAIERFIELEIKFPNKFSRFVLATNYGFWQGKTNGKNLPHLLELVKSHLKTKTTNLDSLLSAFITSLCKDGKSKKVKKNFPVDLSERNALVIRVLNKIELQTDLPNFNDITRAVATRIGDIEEMSDCRMDELHRGAIALVDKIFHASSLDLDSAVVHYFALLDNPGQVKVDTIIDGKRITKDTVFQIVNGCRAPVALLRSQNQVSLVDLPKGMQKLELKMAAGGVSAQNINLAKDYKYSAEYLFNQWIYKYGVRRATEYYAHLSLVVHTEAQEAFDKTKQLNTSFGQEMLSEVRQQIRNRYNQEQSGLWDCKYEHLLGVVGILTEECKLWWSEEFEIPEEPAI